MQNKHLRNLMVGSYKTVQEWNAVFDISASANADMRLCITGEEIIELARAKTKADRVDALCDIIWTLQGTWLDFDAPLIQDDKRYPLIGIYTPIAIMSEFSQWVYRKINTALKPSEYTNDLVPGILTESVCQLLANELGVDGAERAWQEVRRTNFAKLWTPEEVSSKMDTITKDGMTFKFIESHNGMVVRNQHGKIQKPPSWTGPDWSWITEN